MSLLVFLLAGAALGTFSLLRFSLFDDEANAIINASLSVREILSAGFGRQPQFHPPLWELILHGWLALWPGASVAWLRLPALILWLLTVAALDWSLAPIASSSSRLVAVAATIFWPAHLVLPFSASWYALAGLLSVCTFGALVRVLAADSRRTSIRFSAAAVVFATLLGYTVFAWPILLGAELAGLVVIFGWDRVRSKGSALLVVMLSVGLLLMPTLLAVAFRLGPMVHGRVGGGPMQSVGSVMALLAGHSAPGSIVAAVAAACAGIGLALVYRGRQRGVIGTALIGVMALSALAATNTLNDKRLLLGSIFVTGGLGLGLSAAHRSAAAVCLVAAVPAWLGWSGLTRGPWLIPRWQDPIDEVAAYHVASRVPRALVSNQPALAFTIAHMEGDRIAWHGGTHPSADVSSLRWRPLPAGVIAGAIEAYDRAAPQRLKILDVIVSAHMSTYLASLERELSGRGWSIEDRRSYGEDSLARFRHPKHSGARLELLRFSR